jgi:hypothetical protein
MEGWERKLEGAAPDIWCERGVECELCEGTIKIQAIKVPTFPYYYFVCLACQRKLGIKW